MCAKALLVFLVLRGTSWVVASDTCQDGVCDEVEDVLADDTSAMQDFSRFVGGKHRATDVLSASNAKKHQVKQFHQMIKDDEAAQKTQLVSLRQKLAEHTKKEHTEKELAAEALRRSAQKAVLKSQCEHVPSWLSGMSCPEGRVCTYRETHQNLIFTMQKSDGIVKVAFKQHAHILYMTEDGFMLESPCNDGELLKADYLTPEEAENTTMTCDDNGTITDVTPDTAAVVAFSGSGDNGVDLVEHDAEGHHFSDHVDFVSSVPCDEELCEFTVPSSSPIKEVTRQELLDQLSESCSSPELVQTEAMDRVLNKKGIVPMIMGAAMIAGGVAMCVMIPGFGCVLAAPVMAMGASILVSSVALEVKYRVNEARACDFSQKVFITSHRGARLQDWFGNLHTTWNSGAWELWNITGVTSAGWAREATGAGESSADRVYITSYFNHQLQDNHGNVRLHSNKGSWERWQLSWAGDGRFYLTSHRNQRIRDNNGYVDLTPNLDSWERWTPTRANGDKACPR